MSRTTETETLTAAKSHSCSWCGERIIAGDKYKRWRFFCDGEASTCKLHPECYEAMQEANDETWEFYQHSRGCTCYRDEQSDCKEPFCAAKKRIKQTAARAGNHFSQLQQINRGA